MSTNSTATSRSLAAQLELLLQRGVGHVLAHVAAEEVAHPLALAQSGRHAVEAGLEQPHLAAVVDGHLHVQLALLDLAERAAHREHRVRHGAGGEPGDRTAPP